MRSRATNIPCLVRVKDRLTWGEEIELARRSGGVVRRNDARTRAGPGQDAQDCPGKRPLFVGGASQTASGRDGRRGYCPGRDSSSADEHPGKLLSGRSRGLQSGCAAQPRRSGTGTVRRPGRPRNDARDRANVHVPARRKAPFIWRPSVRNGSAFQQAVVAPANCNGCGVCVGACPNRAIDVQGWRLDEFEAMVEAITAETPALEGAG